MPDQVVLAPASNELRTKRLLIHAIDVGRVLMPVLSALHRRHCQIQSMSYEAINEDDGCGHLEVCLSCSSGRLSTVPLWLANVVGVLYVEELP